jgi:hypothetical protein
LRVSARDGQDYQDEEKKNTRVGHTASMEIAPGRLAKQLK